MANVPAPPPPPPIKSDSPTPQPDGPVISEKPSPVQGNTGDAPLYPAQLRELSRNWTLAGDSGLLLYLHDFSQRIISKTSEIDKVVDTLANYTEGSSAKVHNTFNDFLMLSSNQFIENRVYDEEVTEEKNDNKGEEKSEKTREQLEAEVLPKYSKAVEFGLGVLDDAFITVEIKPTEDDSDEDDETSIHATVADPIIEPRDLYSGRPLPHLIGTAEFLHDDTLGLVEIESDDEDKKQNVEESEDESESEEEESMEESDGHITSSSSEEEESDVEEEPVKKKSKKKPVDVDSDDESDEGLFGEEEKKVNTNTNDEEIEGSEEESEVPQTNFQSELASKLGLAKPPRKKTLDEDSDNWDTESQKQDDVSSISSKNLKADTKSISSRRSTGSKSKRGSSIKSETESITSTKNEKRNRTKSGKKSDTKHKKITETEEDDNLFGAPKKDDFFGDGNDEPFAKKTGGLFSGGGNSLFDENEEEEDLFEEKKEEKIFDDDIETKDSPPKHRTTSSGKKLPAGAVSIFGDSDGFFGSPKKDSITASKGESRQSDLTKKPPPVVSGLFDDAEDEDDDMFSATSKNNLSVKSEIPRKKTLELENDKKENNDGDLFGFEKKIEEPSSVKSQKKIPVGGVSMFGGKVPPLINKNIGKTDEAGNDLFSNDDKDDLFGGGNIDSKKDADKKTVESKKKNNIISLFDDGDEEEDDDIFAGLLTAKSPLTKSQPPKAVKQSTLSKSMLFDDNADDDEDELFGEPVTSQKTTQRLAEGSVEPAKEKSKVPSEKKSMFSGDGLFGEKDDLFASKTSQETKENVESKHTVTSEVKRKPIGTPISDPFNDDDDDLFSSKPIKKTPPQIPDPKHRQRDTSEQKTDKFNEKKTLKPVSSLLFDEEEDDDLFGDKPTPAVTKTNNKTAKNEKTAEVEKPQTKKVPSKPTGGVSVFGNIDPLATNNTLKPPVNDMFSEESDDDIFSTGKKNKLEPQTSSNVVATSDEETDNLFSSSVSAKVPKSAVNQETESANKGIQSSPDESIIEENNDDFADSKPKKPVGGVSLFGGIDPLSAKKNLKTPNKGGMFDDDSDDDIFATKKRSPMPVSKPKPITKEIQKKTETLTEAAIDPLSALGSSPNSDKKSLSSQVEVKQINPSNNIKPGSVGKLQASLSFNPGALLPGASPPKKVLSANPSSFDEPADAKTLQSISKTRVKGQAKRRPPTRNGRQGISTDNNLLGDSTDGAARMPSEGSSKTVSSDAFDDKTTLKDAAPSPIATFPESQPEPDSGSSKKIKSIKPSDIFADDDDDDIFSPNAKGTSSVPQSKDMTKNELFSNTDAKQGTSPAVTQESHTNIINSDSNKKPSIFEDEDEIFSNSNKNDIFSGKSSNTGLFEEDADIFGGTTPPIKVSSAAQKNVPKSDIVHVKTVDSKEDKSVSGNSEKSKLDDSDDDLFSTDNTDIFAKAVPKKREPKSDVLTPKKKEKLVDDDDGDLFATNKKKETSKSKQKVVKKKTDEDLFGNSDSIFDDIPSSKEKKKKKKKPEATKDIFATTSEADDIFAPKKTKTKKKNPETETKTKTTMKSNENAPSLIDDPLNALSSGT